MPKFIRIDRNSLWSPSLIIYDTGACTREDHDPAKAVLYYRPRNAQFNARTAVVGQLAGVIHFCKSAFSAPLVVRMRSSVAAVEHFGRFVLIVCGGSKEWVLTGAALIKRMLQFSTGGILALWSEHQETSLFAKRLSSVMDAIVLEVFPDVNFEDEVYASSLSPENSSPSDIPHLQSQLEISAEKKEEGYRKKKGADSLSDDGQNNSNTGQQGGDGYMATLSREMDATFSVPIPKSGAGSFLLAQQLLETCMQYAGVLAGSTCFGNRVLNTQAEEDLRLFFTLYSGKPEEAFFLSKAKLEFQLPPDVALYILNLNEISVTHTVCSSKKFVPTKRKGLHGEANSAELSTLRSALQNQSIRCYPSSVPPLNTRSKDSKTISCKGTKNDVINPLLLCAKISGNKDLLEDGRPSRSLPGSPRKIRVATMLPEVGSNSPELRYKVLTARRPKAGIYSPTTVRRGVGNVDGQNSGKGSGSLQRGKNNLAAPLLKRKEFLITADSTVIEANDRIDKKRLEPNENPITELNLKNAKNKLNLHFAPDEVNKPGGVVDTCDTSNKDINSNSSLVVRNVDDEDAKSDDSDISVLELSNYIESKESGNKLFEEATRMDESPKPDGHEAVADSSVCHCPHSYEQMPNHLTKVVLYQQKSSKMTLYLILDDNASTDQAIICDLYGLGMSALPRIEKSVMKAQEISEEKEGGDPFLQNSSSLLTAIDLPSLSTGLAVAAHRDFTTFPDLTELTLRESEKVLWAHRNCHTETFYQTSASSRPGLPIPSDAMARIPHRARRRMEREHGITVL